MSIVTSAAIPVNDPEPAATSTKSGASASAPVPPTPPFGPRATAAGPPSYHRARAIATPAPAPVPASWDSASAPVLLEQFPAAVAILDKSMKYLAVNSRWIREFQIPGAPITGRSHYDIFPDLHPEWRVLYERCLAGDQKQCVDDVMLRADGSESLVHWEIQPWHESTGPVGGLVLTCASVEAPAPIPVPAPVPVLAPAAERLAASIQSLVTPAEAEAEMETKTESKIPPAPATPSPSAAAPPKTPPISASTLAPAAATAAADDSFREMAEAAPFGMVLLDDQAHILYANPQHRTVLGFAAMPGDPMQTWLERACAGDDVFQKRALNEWWENVWRRRTALTCSLRNAEGLVKDIEFRPAALSGDRLLLTIFDVTDARLDEQAVRTSEARYRGLFQQASAALLMINPAGNIAEVNPAFESLTGLPRHEARRASLTDFLQPDTISRLRAATLAGGQAEGFTTTLRHRSGSEQPVHLSIAVIRNEQGQPAFTACLLAPTPIPAPATAWDRITPDWLFVLDADGTILEHTKPRDFIAWQKQSASPSLNGELLETALTDLVAPLPLDVMIERLLDQPGHETRCEYSLTADGEVPPRRVEARLLLLPGGPPARFGLTLRDVTRARSSTSPGGFSIALLEHLRTPAILTNEKGRILHLNPAAEALSGYPTAELRDSGLHRLFRPDAPREFSEELSRHLKTHRHWHTRSTLTAKDGQSTGGTVELTPAFDEASGARGFILLFRPHEEAPAAAEGSPENAAQRPAISLHRARNDLQVLTSLMALQADQTPDPAARQALLASRDRLAAVSLIYRLIQHEDDPVDFARFATEIGRTLLESHERAPGSITINPLFSGIVLPQRPAISLGLILEELLASSLAWSFPSPDSTGHIRLTLTLAGNEGILILRDNGRPLSESAQRQRDDSFHHKLVSILAGQIGGTVTYLSDLENQVRLSFRLPAGREEER